MQNYINCFKKVISFPNMNSAAPSCLPSTLKFGINRKR